MNGRLGNNIKEARKKNKISQEELAFNSNISRRHMTNIELGRVDIKISTLIKIANALFLSPEMLLKP